MPRYISSRPEEDEDPFVLDDLVPEELELICALLYNVRLGHSSPYRAAASSLLNKIEQYMGDDDFSEKAAEAVDATIAILNNQGVLVGALGRDNFEINV